MRGFLKPLAIYCLALVSAVTAEQLETLVPAPKLRPSDPSKFYPVLVKMGPQDIDDLRNVLRQANRGSVAESLTDKASLDALAGDAELLALALDCPSTSIRDWTLRTLGERKLVKPAIKSKLLPLLSNKQAGDETRALAARVIATVPPDSSTLSLIVEQLPEAGTELKRIFIEILGGAGKEAAPFVSTLREYLNHSDGGVQFSAFDAIRKIEPPGPSDELNLQILENNTAPKYLKCAALLAATSGTEGDIIAGAVLKAVGDADSFVSEVAANVLQRLQLTSAAVPSLATGLSHSTAAVRLQSALALRKLGAEGVSAVPALADRLAQLSTVQAPPSEILALLELIRALGHDAASLGPPLVDLLPEQASIYSNIGKHDAYQIRSCILVTLSEIGVPNTALPYIIDGLANSDSRTAHLFAASARAAAALGPQARAAVPFLLRPFERSIDDQLVSFEKFTLRPSTSEQYTSCRLEALRALQQIGPAAKQAAPVLKAFIEGPPQPAMLKLIANPQKQARQTLEVIESASAP